MAVEPERILPAAKAAYPELWPDIDEKDMSGERRAGLAIARQQALSRVTEALEAYDGPTSGDSTQQVVLVMPEGAMMVQQVLTTITYIDSDGRVAYSVRTIGDGLMSSWLGMCVLTQNYLLNQQGEDGED